MSELPKYGAVPTDARLVDEGQVVTAGGVTCALDLGMLLVRRFEGDEAADRIAAQMCLPDAYAPRRPSSSGA
jgi:transcriptional regulator GlxA family with amidase domain